VLYLLAVGASLSAKNRSDVTPAQLALSKGHFRVAKICVAAQDTSLSKENVRALPLFIQKLFEPYTVTLIEFQKVIENSYSNPLYNAIALRDTDALELLCRKHPKWLSKSSNNLKNPLEQCKADGFLDG
jgi:hypothetical protein